MNTLNSRLAYLWQQFTGRTATRAELDELMELLSSDIHDEENRQYLQSLLEATPAADNDITRWAPVLRSILHPEAAIPENFHDPTQTPFIEHEGLPRTRRLVRRIMTAAAVLLFLLGSFYLWRIIHPERSVDTSAINNVKPGGNKAVLTLAGGQQIILDSAANGLLTVQGSARIEKLGDGRLAYQADSKTPQSIASIENTLTTPRGGQYQLTLPDGTRVWLNAASSITYPTAFTGNDRTVTMTGEAYFEVAHDPKKPFTVKAGGQLIEDIGTHFNVNAYTDEPAQVTTLLEGSIRIAGHMLRPGEKATVAASGGIEVSKGDPDQAVAWKNGLFDFSDAGIEAVMRQLSRWYAVDITFEGNISPRQFNGSIGRSLTLGQVLKGLASERVHYRLEGERHLIVTP